MIIGVDPGKTTGWATWDGERLIANQAPWEDFINGINLTVEPGWLFVVERFTITQATLRLGRELEALYCIGGLMTLGLIHGFHVELQSVGAAKSFATDDKLKKMGWWIPNRDHAMDAARHVLTYLAVNKLIDLSKLRNDE